MGLLGWSWSKSVPTQAQPVLPMMWFFSFGSLDTSWASCPDSRQFPGHTALSTTHIQISCGTAATGGISEESGECCTLREQTAPELVMDPHCTEKQAHLQLGLQTGRERREEELALGPWEPPAPLGHSFHLSCQEAIHVPGEHSGMQHTGAMWGPKLYTEVSFQARARTGSFCTDSWALWRAYGLAGSSTKIKQTHFQPLSASSSAEPLTKENWDLPRGNLERQENQDSLP